LHNRMKIPFFGQLTARPQPLFEVLPHRGVVAIRTKWSKPHFPPRRVMAANFSPARPTSPRRCEARRPRS
jgi:hypothetical protein